MKFCEHINLDNREDCFNEAEYACICCGVPVCAKHKEKVCPYGGEGYIEL